MRAVVFVPVIVRRDEVKVAFKHRANQKVDPFRRNRPRKSESTTAHASACSAAAISKIVRNAEPLPGDAVIRERQPVNPESGVCSTVAAGDRRPRLPGRHRSSVLRTAVGVNDHCLELRKVLLQSRLRRANYVSDGADIVIAGDSDDDIGPPQLLQSGNCISRKRQARLGLDYCVHAPMLALGRMAVRIFANAVALEDSSRQAENAVHADPVTGFLKIPNLKHLMGLSLLAPARQGSFSLTSAIG